MSGPHAKIAAETARERFALKLFDRLWDEYRRRVSYVQTYETMLERLGATFVNDHIAFRTIASQTPGAGIHSISRVFEALGFRAAGNYQFADKFLAATHYQHENPSFPKLFVSELQTWALPEASRRIIANMLDSHRAPLAMDLLAELTHLDEAKASDVDKRCLDPIVSWFTELPWTPPGKSELLALNAVSQYGAWVLVHGYNVNHFTALVNSHGVPAIDDLEKTVAALAEAGVPVKTEIEGARGSKLRQSSTEAVMTEVSVVDAGRLVQIPWTYAYFELAQRDWLTDTASGKPVRFEGFLGPQATNLFEMTRLHQ